MSILDFPRNDFSLPPKKKLETENLHNFFIKTFSLKFRYFVEQYLEIWHAKFQVDISFLGNIHIAQKTHPLITDYLLLILITITDYRLSVDDFIFSNCNSEHCFASQIYT